jgi:hypothetical protein
VPCRGRDIQKRCRSGWRGKEPVGETGCDAKVKGGRSLAAIPMELQQGTFEERQRTFEEVTLFDR